MTKPGKRKKAWNCYEACKYEVGNKGFLNHQIEQNSDIILLCWTFIFFLCWNICMQCLCFFFLLVGTLNFYPRYPFDKIAPPGIHKYNAFDPFLAIFLKKRPQFLISHFLIKVRNHNFTF